MSRKDKQKQILVHFFLTHSQASLFKVYLIYHLLYLINYFNNKKEPTEQ